MASEALGERVQRDRVVYAIDGSGRFAVASRKPGRWSRIARLRPRLGIAELATGAWLLPPASRHQVSMLRHVTRAGRGVWHHEAGDRSALGRLLYVAFGAVLNLQEPAVVYPLRDDSGVWLIRDGAFVRYDASGVPPRRAPGLPAGIVIQAIDFEPATGVLLLGTWGKVQAFAIGDTAVHRATLELGGVDLRGLALRGRHAVVVTEDAAYHLAVDGALERRGELVPAARLDRPLMCDLSSDGRWIALAGRDGVVLLVDTESGELRELADHGARLTALRFTDGDASLVSADRDGGVVVRPREAGGW